MISYKKINLTGLYIHGTELRYNIAEDSLIIKSPIINAEKDNGRLILKINKDSHVHDNFMNVCGYIKTLYKIWYFNKKPINGGKPAKDSQHKVIMILIRNELLKL